MIVAGAGMAGLVCAARARELGLHPRVVEKGTRAGGSMLLSSCVVWRHLDWDDFRAECPAGDETLQRLIWERLDDALAWLVSLGAEPVWEDTENPRTTGKRFDPRALVELLAHDVELDSPVASDVDEPLVLATGGFGKRLAAERGLLVRAKAAALGTSNWSGLVMSGKPASSSSPANPNWYLAPASCTTSTCTGLQIDQTPNDGSVSAPTGAATISSAESLVVAAGSCTTWVTCVPLTTPVTGGTASIYVTTASDQTLTVASTTYQPKRITVAVTLAAAGSSHTVTEPTWVSTVVSPQVTAQ